MNEYKTAKPLILMTKPVGAQCNMKCSYCYYLEKESLQHSAPRIMDDVTLEIFIKNYIMAQNGGFAHFIWHGGESFMAGVDFYQKVVDLQYKVTTKKRNAERYSDRIELQGFQSCFRLFVKPSQSPLKPNQDAATLLVRNHARKGDKRTRIAKQGVKD